MKKIAIDIETNGLRIDGALIWMLSITRGNKTELLSDPNGITTLPLHVKKEFCDRNVMKIVHSGVFDLPMIETILKA